MQDFGGALVVIADNKEYEKATSIVMVDDGSGSSIRIPSFLISQQDGQKLKDRINSEDGGGMMRSNMVMIRADITLS